MLCRGVMGSCVGVCCPQCDVSRNHAYGTFENDLRAGARCAQPSSALSSKAFFPVPGGWPWHPCGFRAYARLCVSPCFDLLDGNMCLPQDTHASALPSELLLAMVSAEKVRPFAACCDVLLGVSDACCRDYVRVLSAVKLHLRLGRKVGYMDGPVRPYN